MKRISILLALALMSCNANRSRTQQQMEDTTATAKEEHLPFESKKVQEGQHVLLDTVISIKQSNVFMEKTYLYDSTKDQMVLSKISKQELDGDSTFYTITTFQLPDHKIIYKYESWSGEEENNGRSTITIDTKKITTIIDEEGKTVIDCRNLSFGDGDVHLECCNIKGQPYVILQGYNTEATGSFALINYGLLVPLASGNTTAYLITSYGDEDRFFPQEKDGKFTYLAAARLEDGDDETTMDSTRMQVVQLDIHQ